MRQPSPASVECHSPGALSYLLRPWDILRAVRREDLPADILAGLTVAAVAIPQAIAYAAIAELPPQCGLYAAAVAAVVGALWGCSRYLATGPVNATSLLVWPILLAVATPGTPEYLLAASVVALLAGLLRILLALLRFGALVTLASRAVLIGFAAGAAVHIAIGQLRHLLGLNVRAYPELYRTIGALFDAAAGLHMVSLGLGLGTVALLIALRRLGPRVPAGLVAIVAASLAVALFGLQEQGVKVVGTIPRSLPPWTFAATGMWPNLHLIRDLAVGSLAVAALGLIEAVAAAQVLARRSGDRLDHNQEFFGQGLANIGAGLLSGYPVSGSFTRSSLAQLAGARTHLTAVVTGLAILAAMLLFAPYARLIPKAAIAGVLLAVAWSMVDREGIRRAIRTSRSEAAVMLITFLATLVLPLDFAVLSGVVFSLAFFVIKSSLPRVHAVVPDATFRHLVHNPGAPACPQLGIMNIRGPLFFGAVYHLEEELRHNYRDHPGQNILMLRMHGVDICDLSGIEMLESTVQTYRQMGGDVFLVRPRQPVLAVMEQSGFLDETLGRDHILPQEGAIEYLFEEVLDPMVCIYECEQRVFAECQALEKHTYDIEVPPAPMRATEHSRHMAPAEFQDLAADPAALLLDIREAEEYTHGHLPGAELLPLRLLATKGDQLPRERTLLLACRSGRRTARALAMLEDMGFARLYGLKGGILAWRAEGLPVTTPEDGRAPAYWDRDFPALPRQAAQQRQALGLLRIKSRTEELAEKLERLARTEDLSELQQNIEELLGQLAAVRPAAGGLVTLDPEQPVMIVSDSHALRGALLKLLQDTYLGNVSNLECLVEGKLQLVLLGDLLHSDNRSRWQAIEDEYMSSFVQAGEQIGPTPSLDREMAAGFGLAAMVMTLLRSVPGVHCLKGNHDNLLNSEELGNAKFSKHVAWPGEGEIVRAWTLLRFGPTFAGKYHAWENSLPLLATGQHEDCCGFAASHSEPAGPYGRQEIVARTDEVVFGLTWTRNKGVFVPDVLRNLFGRDWMQARYIASHTGSDEGIIQVPEKKLVIINKPRHLVAAVIRPDKADFDVHIVAGI